MHPDRTTIFVGRSPRSFLDSERTGHVLFFAICFFSNDFFEGAVDPNVNKRCASLRTSRIEYRAKGVIRNSSCVTNCYNLIIENLTRFARYKKGKSTQIKYTENGGFFVLFISTEGATRRKFRDDGVKRFLSPALHVIIVSLQCRGTHRGGRSYCYTEKRGIR